MLKKIFLFILCLSISPYAFAGLSIEPSRTEITLKPGESFNGFYVVKNDYNTPIDVVVSAKNWFMLPDNKDVEVKDWLNISNKTVHLEPGQSSEVPFEVNISSGMEGVLVGMFSFTPKTKIKQNITMVVSVSVFATVSGTEKIAWGVTDIKFEKDKLQVSAEIGNSGNIHVRPQGFVKIMKKNKEIAKFEFIEGRPVYPGSERVIVARHDQGLKKGKYDVLVNIFAFDEEVEAQFKMKIGKSGEISVK
ncbi:hypothetical protein ACFL58_00585 [Elusimicrobiota bacterium]